MAAHRQIWSIFVALLFRLAFVSADVTIPLPLMNQLPPIAYPDQAFHFKISQNTFGFAVPQQSEAPVSPPSISYAATNLPSWLTFDPASLVFSGTAPAEDEGKPIKVSLTGSLPSGTSAFGGNTSATDTFTLLILDEPAPTVKVPIVQQFPGASSLGEANMMAPDTIHLPLGWSFSIGLRGDTFAISTGADVFWSVKLQDGSPLPSWLKFQPNSYDFYGNAPTDGTVRQGNSFVVVVTGSNRPGYGGASQSFTLAVSPHSLALQNGLPAVNATIGQPFQYQIPLDNLTADGSRITETSQIYATADIGSAASWLTFDQSSRFLSGTVPYDPYGNSSSITHVQVPISFAGPNNTEVTVNQTIRIAPSAFTGIELPNVFIKGGESVNVDLKQFLRGTTSNASSRRSTAKRAPTDVNQSNLNVTMTPANASTWLHYDPSSLTLSGQVPTDWNTRVQVALASLRQRSNTISNASFFLAFDGDNSVGNPTNNSSNWTGKDEGEGEGPSSKTKIAIGASLGAAAAVAAIILLLFCCRRRRHEEDFDRSRSTEGRDDDEGTLTDKGNRQWKKAVVVGRAGVGEMHTPSTAAVSPMPGFEGEKMEKGESLTPPRVNDLHSVVVVSPNGGRRNAIHEAEAPTQSRLIANLFTGGRALPQDQTRNKRRSKGVNANSTGLGLSLGEGEHDDPFAGPIVPSDSRGRINHRRSRESVNSHRSSWESDLFYEDAPSTQQNHGSDGHRRPGSGGDDPFGGPLSGAGEDDLPRRRGKSASNGLNVRHRNTHINESPAFHAPDAFTPSSLPLAVSEQSLDRNGMSAADSGLSASDFHDSITGIASNGMQEDARILKARVMQVQRHSPVLHQGANNPVAAHTASARAYDISHGGGAFDDAEDDMEWTNDSAYPGDRNVRGAYGQDAKRNSTMSAMTDGSHLAGVRAHFAREAAIEQQRNPSFMDGVSISGIDPKESMKPVITHRPTTPEGQRRQQQQQPRTPSSKRKPGSAGSAASGRFLPCPTVNAVMGHLLRFRLYPSVPPPMAGAPSSPGKRSGRTVRYELVMDDDRPHLAQFKGEWPAMLADWLHIDATTFEVEGVVPRMAELEQLGDCSIALISTTRISGNAFSPDRDAAKRNSTSSYESTGRASISNDEERTVVARAKLVFQNPAPRGYMPPRLGQAF